MINSEGKISFLCFKSPALRAGQRAQGQNQEIWSNLRSEPVHPHPSTAGLEAGEGGRFLVRAPGGPLPSLGTLQAESRERTNGNNRISDQCGDPKVRVLVSLPSERSIAISVLLGCLAGYGSRRPFCGVSSHMGRRPHSNHTWPVAPSCRQEAQKSSERHGTVV